MTWQNLLSGKLAIVRGASRGLGRVDAFRLTAASTSRDVTVTDFLIELDEDYKRTVAVLGELNYSTFKKQGGR